MSVFKRYSGKKIDSRHPKWEKGTWYCWIRVDGKPLHRALNARTKEQAEKAEKVLVDKIINGEDNERRFSEFVDDVYVRYIQTLKSKETQEIFIPVLKSFFKDEWLHKIKPQKCRDYRTWRQQTPTKHKETRSNASLNREMAALSKIFSLAVEEGCCKENPVSKVKKLKEDDPRHRVLSESQQLAFWRELEGDLYLKRLVLLALNLPLRKEQILSIRRKDVDLENLVLWASESKGKPPRPIFINDIALPVFESLLADYADALFPMKRFQKRWQRLLERAGINKVGGTRKENFHFHDLRTMLGTTMMDGGTHPRVVQGTFNHSNMTTSSIYMAVGFERQKEALQRVAATYAATNFFDETSKTQ